MYEGKIMFRIDYGGTSKLEITTIKKYNSGRWTSVEVAREFTSKRSTENGNLKVNNEEPLTGAPSSPITSSLLPDLSRAVYYLGGIPPDFKFAITKAPGADNAYLGCMKDIQINGETYDPLETSLRNGVEVSCKESITRYAATIKLETFSADFILIMFHIFFQLLQCGLLWKWFS